MPRSLKQGILGAILSINNDKYAFMCGSNFNETDAISALWMVSSESWKRLRPN